MSRKSSWFLRPQRKGASNRAALNEANYFMEHNKILQERINELVAENAKLRAMTDAIKDLRDDLQRVNAAVQDAEHDESMAWDRVRKAEADNTKLRELAVLQSVIFKHMSTCPTTYCQVCPVKEECAESVHLEGLLGIDDKDTSWLVQCKGGI